MKLVDYVEKALIRLHRNTGKDFLHLAEIYDEVALLRNKPNPNKGASIRAVLEKYCKKSDVYCGVERFISLFTIHF